jgi:restriction endonuclease S subunit
MYPLTVRSGFDARFVHYYTLSDDFTSQAVSQQDRTGIPKLNRDQLTRILIPRPSLAEQRAIVSVLAAIRAAVDAQENIVVSLKKLKAATMAKLFRDGLRGEPLKRTEIGEIPESWELGSIDDVRADERGAVVSGPFGSNIGSRFFVADGVPLIRGNNLTKGDEVFLDNGFVFITEAKAEELRSSTALPRDLIFTAAGSIGQVGMIPTDCKHEKYVISNKQLRARVDLTKADPLFLFYWFSSPNIQRMFVHRQSGTSIPVINLRILRSIPVPLLSLKEQIDIAESCKKVHDRLRFALRRQEAIRTLFTSMLRLLMTGQLRVMKESAPVVRWSESVIHAP